MCLLNNWQEHLAQLSKAVTMWLFQLRIRFWAFEASTHSAVITDFVIITDRVTKPVLIRRGFLSQLKKKISIRVVQ